MPELNILLKVEGTQYFIESNINLRPASKDLYAQIWFHSGDKVFADLLREERGEHSLTDCVLWLSERLGRPIGHKIQKAGREEVVL